MTEFRIQNAEFSDVVSEFCILNSVIFAVETKELNA